MKKLIGSKKGIAIDMMILIIIGIAAALAVIFWQTDVMDLVRGTTSSVGECESKGGTCVPNSEFCKERGKDVPGAKSACTSDRGDPIDGVCCPSKSDESIEILIKGDGDEKNLLTMKDEKDTVELEGGEYGIRVEGIDEFFDCNLKIELLKGKHKMKEDYEIYGCGEEFNDLSFTFHEDNKLYQVSFWGQDTQGIVKAEYITVKME